MLVVTPGISQAADDHSTAPFIADGTRNQAPQAGKLKGSVIRIKRPLLMVKDLAESITFYESVIGLELYAVEQAYNTDPTSIGNPLFNLPRDTRRRVATFNTSNEVRGLALRELPDLDFEVSQSPRVFTLLFESDDILGVRERALKAEAEVIGPVIAQVAATDQSPELRYMELGVVDPNGHVIAFFQYFTDDAEWEAAKKAYTLVIE
ncbi:MAG: VOC family protein [Pseudomonadota bacterium]